jgi:hypothetical protein
MPFDDTTRTTDTVRILDEVIAVLGHYARRKLKTPAGHRLHPAGSPRDTRPADVLCLC